MSRVSSPDGRLDGQFERVGGRGSIGNRETNRCVSKCGLDGEESVTWRIVSAIPRGSQ